MSSRRRTFLQQAALAGFAPDALAAAPQSSQPANPPNPAPRIAYPRLFRGRQLAMIAFPLGGVCAGSISLGGRGQLRDWEIFNKPDKGNSPAYALPAIFVQAGQAPPIARVLEARVLPPYEGQNGLGSRNAPGLARLASATFTGEFPLAHIDFADPSLPVKVSLDAFSPFIPHEPDDSGLPVAILRYTVSNPGPAPARVSIAWSIDNPINSPSTSPASAPSSADTRLNEFRTGDPLQGLFLTNPALSPSDPLHGSFALCVHQAAGGKVTWLRGWPKGRWWNSPMLFWDDFSADGALGPEPADRNGVAALCLERTIAPAAKATYTFLLAWHFPNRTPARCGWQSPKGDENTIIGNWYATQFPNAWEAAQYAARNLDHLEARTRRFAQSLRESTLPTVVKEAASANLSTLVSTTSFRTADGEFHGFEGVNDKLGCCFGNCTHVWNYETTTPFLFPTFARSLRKAAFGFSMDDAGAMHFRQLLPDGKARSGFAAADGQMGQIIHAYLDWRLSGDLDWLRALWPRIKKALEFAWVPGGWDADRDGVLEGVQHNTYDVEFYGPNPQCGIYFIAALRAAERMARAVGDPDAPTYAKLAHSGAQWIDANLFQGEFYVQKIRGFSSTQIAPSLRSKMGSDDTEHPEYQVGEGCLVDQLVGQYLAEAAGLGTVMDPAHVRKTLQSLYKYNYKRSLVQHDAVQRIFAVNDESALVICDYGKAPRPHIPFPYYAEVMTGFEYSAAIHMLFAGMTREGLECIASIRARYDGEKRNPWDEAECGHHYARAMAAWSGILALNGFSFDGAEGVVRLAPPNDPPLFRSFWSNATAWGVYSRHRTSGNQFKLEIQHGQFQCRVCEVNAAGKVQVWAGADELPHQLERRGPITLIKLAQPLLLNEGSTLRIEVTG